jgi:nucleoside-diphosphate-sugar epimerase
MSTLVTGGLGFLGQALVERLRARGERVVDYNRREGHSEDPEHVFVQGELLDLGRLLTSIRDHKVERIIHTAAMSHPGYSLAMPYSTVQANVVGTNTVLEAARLGGVRQLVNLSSEAAYGPQPGPGPLKETAVLMPEDIYGATKVATEHLSRLYGQHYGFATVSLRVGWIYGPRQKMQCYLHELLRAAIDGRPWHTECGREQRFHYVWVYDVADACILAANKQGPKYDAYNITGDEEHTYQQVADLVKIAVPEADFQLGPGDWGFYQQPLFDLTRAREDLGYQPTKPLAERIPEYAEWLRRHEY